MNGKQWLLDEYNEMVNSPKTEHPLIDAGYETALKDFKEIIDQLGEPKPQLSGKKWLKDKLDKRIGKLPPKNNGLYSEGARDAYTLVLQDLDQLDEPALTETSALLENVLKENKRLGQLCQEKQEEIYKLLDSQSNKTEKVVVPKFVAKWFENNKHDINQGIYDICSETNENEKYETHTDMTRWIIKLGVPFAEILIKMKDGYTVEEKKYEVKDKYGCYILIKNLNGEVINAYGKTVYEKGKQLTEQEIKDYDERYWPFAEEVTE